MSVDRSLRILEIVALLLPLMGILLQAAARLFDTELEIADQQQARVLMSIVLGMFLVTFAGIAAIVNAMFSGVSWQIGAILLALYLGLATILYAGAGIAEIIIPTDDESGTQQTLFAWASNDSAEADGPERPR